jgi:DNA-binding transcriptional LysR family regulator
MASESEWDLFRTFDEVVRRKSLTAAARALRVSQSTVSRHLARLEKDAGSPLLLRETPIRLTERGELLRRAIEPMAAAASGALAALESAPELRGEVTITTVAEVARWVLVPALASFYGSYPHLQLRILASNARASLAAGEADIALRMARPARGDLVAKKLASESFGFFAAATLRGKGDVPWLGLTASLEDIAEQRHAARAFAPRPARLLVEDVESLALAVQAGLGVAVLPRRLAARLDGVVELEPSTAGARDLGPVPDRQLWMVVHKGKQRIPKIRAVLSWLSTVITPKAV